MSVLVNLGLGAQPQPRRARAKEFEHFNSRTEFLPPPEHTTEKFGVRAANEEETDSGSG